VKCIVNAYGSNSYCEGKIPSSRDDSFGEMFNSQSFKEIESESYVSDHSQRRIEEILERMGNEMREREVVY
jgi:hypothetical protein